MLLLLLLLISFALVFAHVSASIVVELDASPIFGGATVVSFSATTYFTSTTTASILSAAAYCNL